MKLARVDVCQDLLARNEQAAPDFLERIVTGDESGFLFYDPESKQQSMEWRKPGEPAPTKVRTSQSAMKRMATVFWDSEGILLIQWLPQGRTINSQYYCEVLSDLREAIKKERRGKLTRGVLLLHDNARPHTSRETQAKIQELGFIQLPHPPYSPDLAPSDYWLFGAMKKELRGRRFETLQQLATAVHKWRQNTPKDWFAAGIRKLPERWQLCIHRSDFVELATNDDI